MSALAPLRFLPVGEAECDVVLAALDAGALNAAGVALWLGDLAAFERAEVVLSHLRGEGRVAPKYPRSMLLPDELDLWIRAESAA